MTDDRNGTLTDEHLSDLRKSGLNDDTIATMGAYSLTALKLAPTLGHKPSGIMSALALPYPGLDFTRYKLFPPGRSADGHSLRYIQAVGSGVHLYILPAVQAVLSDVSVPLFFSEGEKKAARATHDGFPCIGLGGLWNFLEAGTADGISEFDGIVHVNRQETIVPDSDVWTRPDLMQAVYALGRELESRGACVKVVMLPSPDGRKVGLDDFLVANAAEAFRAIPRFDLKHAAFTKQRDWYKVWKKKRSHTPDATTGQGKTLTLRDPDPWPEAVDGAALLDGMARVLMRYVVLPAGAVDAAVLWTLHTYLIDVLHLSPILVITSPEKRCGKSTLLDVLRALVRRPLGASNITAAALFRAVEQWAPTLLIDEADTFLAARDELRGILNAGHARSTAQVVRTVGEDHEPCAFRTFCPKAIAAIGELPGTIEDRAIIMRMKRRAPGEHVERLRRDRIDAELEPLRGKAARWAADNASAIRAADPDISGALDDRAADNWRPLLAIADAAGADWPMRARRAAQLLSATTRSEDSTVRVQLLADIRDTFRRVGADRLSTDALLMWLNALPERPWPEWGKQQKPLTPRGLAKLLKAFRIESKTVRLTVTETAKGYERADFEDAFTRYLPPASVTPSQPAPALEEVEVSHPSHGCRCDGSENATLARKIRPCDAVTDSRTLHREGCGPERCSPSPSGEVFEA